ncbi:amino acid ABC transporter membrane protein 2, PAAT family (TC 3.A.1.3.-) [Pseudomonas sp. ok272]|uniref:amino acid ABC transporter permease n=1 Tax=unclassified Pseudomonas TaxID=196821 RepID=UPI0008CE05A2|nr:MULTISPECIES: amino acid ABC transporter permease [unclassified Pseudomonas]SEM62068.1 amino acid ABC transporter membrane protein 2, PAAT family (TC 3.A.1.3.-) [Pseudomonas sp. ok272]SFM48121.1 amino acid ABC transporter membrane protein 2, PAAT family (TC 3.A.1.3.-) [Pseudomonas sp. ok602]
MLDIIHEYWLLFLIGSYPNGPLGGIAATVLLSIIGIGVAFPLSVLLALAQLSPFKVIRYPATAIRYLLRSIPLVMLIFGAYFIVPMILGRPVAGFTTMAVTLVVFQSVYLAEIIRAGIESLPKGQAEAAAALGMGYWTRTFKIILPQALTTMLPSMVGQFVTTIKDTSLGYVIGVNELTYAANQVNSTVITEPFTVFLVLSMAYFVICFSLTQTARLLEARLERRYTRAVTHTPLNAPSAPAAGY